MLTVFTGACKLSLAASCIVSIVRSVPVTLRRGRS